MLGAGIDAASQPRHPNAMGSSRRLCRLEGAAVWSSCGPAALGSSCPLCIRPLRPRPPRRHRRDAARSTRARPPGNPTARGAGRARTEAADGPLSHPAGPHARRAAGRTWPIIKATWAKVHPCAGMRIERAARGHVSPGSRVCHPRRPVAPPGSGWVLPVRPPTGRSRTRCAIGGTLAGRKSPGWQGPWRVKTGQLTAAADQTGGALPRGFPAARTRPRLVLQPHVPRPWRPPGY
jgi:hypothetical protein